jgi:hypothetical protein
MSDLALHQAHAELAHAHDRFNALAQVAGREMPKFLKRAYTVPLTIGVTALGAASEAKFGTKGAIANAILAGVAYGVGMLAGENADLREGAYTIATGLGGAAAAIASYDKVTSMIATSQAPAPAPAAS